MASTKSLAGAISLKYTMIDHIKLIFPKLHVEPHFKEPSIFVCFFGDDFWLEGTIYDEKLYSFVLCGPGGYGRTLWSSSPYWEGYYTSMQSELEINQILKHIEIYISTEASGELMREYEYYEYVERKEWEDDEYVSYHDVPRYRSTGRNYNYKMYRDEVVLMARVTLTTMTNMSSDIQSLVLQYFI